MELRIIFQRFTPNGLRRRTPISNQLEYLSITCPHAEDIRSLISNIPLNKGAYLSLVYSSRNGGLNDILSHIPATHFPNLQLPTRVHSHNSCIRSYGPNGSFWFESLSPSEMSFVGLPLLSFGRTRGLHPRGSKNGPLNPSIFPVLETLALERNSSPQGTLSILFSSPESFPLPKTLAFLDRNLSEVFMESLARFASERKNTTSVGLGRVVIACQERESPSAESIRAVERHVSVVDVRPSPTELPDDLRWCREW